MATEPVWPSVETEAWRPEKVPEEAGIPEVDKCLGGGLLTEAAVQELHHLHLGHRATRRVLLGLRERAEDRRAQFNITLTLPCDLSPQECSCLPPSRHKPVKYN